MEDKIVYYYTANLALEKGFNEDCFYHYNGKYLLENSVSDKQNVATHHLLANHYDFEIERWGGGNKNSIPAPYLSVLQKWLREIHNIHVYAFYEFNLHYFYVRINANILSIDINNKNCQEFNKYEEALEVGLFEALKLI